ncbi:sur7 [Pyrenophora seminiperda CCB06]|uniref:Sur7 n=1 Tax=Pyrenophora seminiperda CCB06 TaxID=1302712 RepID=A0A3M7LXG6_9PLEO|nr:sur7 [Pyrenophora seminiperda CCB06]
MRFLALLPVLCSTAALILSFLCLFAGHKKGFMEEYSLLTLNTSAVGENLISSVTSSAGSSPLSSLWNLIPDSITNGVDSITNGVTNEINEQINAFRERAGIEDFYSAHMLNYCEGQFEPGEKPTATLSQKDISKNVTECSKSRAAYKFNPTQIIENALRKSGINVTLQDLKWPGDLQDGIDALNAAFTAMFVLYVLAIVLIFLTLVASAISFFLSTSSRLVPGVNFLFASLAFLTIALASAVATAVMVKGTDVINEHGKPIGLEAVYGNKFLALTWAATGVMLVALVAWVAEFFIGRRKSGFRGEKVGMYERKGMRTIRWV